MPGYMYLATINAESPPEDNLAMIWANGFVTLLAYVLIRVFT